ncbi:MAG: hypothetical protein ABI227_09940, partial [Rhodanobacter sp.]
MAISIGIDGAKEKLMERQIAISESGRHWQPRLGFVLGLLWLSLGIAHAAAPLNGAWREIRARDTPQIVLDEYRAGLLKSFDPSLLQRFPR